MTSTAHWLLLLLLVAGAGCKGNSSTLISPTQERCGISLSTTSSTIGAAGGSGSLAVTTARECQWSATSDAAWLSFTSENSGQGTGSVSYAVAPNPSTTPRRGGIVVSGQRAEITQEAATCRATVSPAAASMGPSGGEVRFTISTDDGCPWTAVSQAAWIAVESAPNGTGRAEVTLRIAANGDGARTGTASIAGVDVTVSQAAVTCSFDVTPTAFDVASAGSSLDVAVTAPPGCGWIASTPQSWIQITQGANGSGNGSIRLTILPNAGAARSGNLAVAGRTVVVDQSGVAASPCDYSISPTSLNAPSGGGPTSVSVTTVAGCGWTATSNASWITITSGGSGTGNGTVNLSIAANPDGARTGTAAIAGQTFTVTQASGCTFTLNPTSFNAPPGGGATSLSVATVAGCGWTATSNASWITITSGGSGTGNGTVNLSIAASSGAARTGTVTVAGQTFTVTQADGCTYSINPTSYDAPADGGQTNVGVATGAGCPLPTATSNAPWITIIGVSDNGTVNLIVAPNSGPERTGTVTIIGQTFTVTQADGCTYSLSSTNANVPNTAGTTSVGVTASSSGCTRNATSGASWLTVTSGGNGTGNGTVNLSFSSNTGPQRTGTVTVTGSGGFSEPFTVTQAGGCTYAINPTSFNAPSGGGPTNISVATVAGCGWTATSNASWITITSGSSGTGNGTVNLSIAANSGPARAGTVTIQGQTFTVNQAGGCTYAIAPNSNAFPAAGGPVSVTVTTPTGCAWTVSGAPAWITAPAGGTGTQTITLTAAQNTGAARSQNFTIAGQTFSASQASGCTYSINPTSFTNVPSSGGSTPVTVTTNAGCTWNVTGNPAWATANPSSGTGGGSTTITVPPNSGPAQGPVTFQIAGQNFTVSQQSGCSYTLSSTSFTNVPSSGGSTPVTVTTTAGCTWNVTGNPAWVTANPTSGTGGGSTTITVLPNSGPALGPVTFQIAGQNFTVSQQSGCTYSLSSSSFTNVPASGGSTVVTVTTGAGCAWNVTGNPAWVTASPTSGTGGVNPSTTITVLANLGPARGPDTFQIAGQNFTVSQLVGP